MAKQTVTKELKDIINSAGREQIANILKVVRQNDALKILCHMGSEEKQYSEIDFWRRQIQVVNALLKLPNRTVEVEEEIDIEEMIEKEAENLDIGDVDSLFKTQDV